MQAGIQISCNEAQSIQRSLDVWNESREANGYFEIPFVSEATLSTHCRHSVIDLGFLKPVIRDRLHISKSSRNTYMYEQNYINGDQLYVSVWHCLHQI